MFAVLRICFQFLNWIFHSKFEACLNPGQSSSCFYFYLKVQFQVLEDIKLISTFHQFSIPMRLDLRLEYEGIGIKKTVL